MNKSKIGLILIALSVAAFIGLIIITLFYFPPVYIGAFKVI
jgi:hypothetical protein